MSECGTSANHFLKPLAYVMLGCFYLTSIHAACVVLNGIGVLLCADSGAGKLHLRTHVPGVARR